MTDQCHAATALLTREYQVDSSSPILTLTASRATTQGAPAALPPKAPLDNYFHIRSLPRNLMEGEGGAALVQQKGRSGPQDDGVLGPVLEYKWRTMERTRGSENAFVNRRSGVRISPSAPTSEYEKAPTRAPLTSSGRLFDGQLTGISDQTFHRWRIRYGG